MAPALPIDRSGDFGTVAGRVEGDIYALRVKLQATAVVEGGIFHRSLSMDEHARFEGCSRPEDNPPEPRPYIKSASAMRRRLEIESELANRRRMFRKPPDPDQG
jgi:cytoskeletal protein CcmA (bactofilin family)